MWSLTSLRRFCSGRSWRRTFAAKGSSFEARSCEGIGYPDVRFLGFLLVPSSLSLFPRKWNCWPSVCVAVPTASPQFRTVPQALDNRCRCCVSPESKGYFQCVSKELKNSSNTVNTTSTRSATCTKYPSLATVLFSSPKISWNGLHLLFSSSKKFIAYIHFRK